MHGSDQQNLSASLCRREGQTCGACCWGAGVTRETLRPRLLSQLRSFRRLTRGGRRLSAWRLLLHECFVYRGRNLVWAVLLRIPSVSGRLKKRLATRLICPFIAFDDETEQSVGCLLHPTRREGTDVRSDSAFRFLPGIECGDPHYICEACQFHDQVTPKLRAQFLGALEGLDWYEYTQSLRLFSAGVPQHGVAQKAITSSTDTASSTNTASSVDTALLPILPE